MKKYLFTYVAFFWFSYFINPTFVVNLVSCKSKHCVISGLFFCLLIYHIFQKTIYGIGSLSLSFTLIVVQWVGVLKVIEALVDLEGDLVPEFDVQLQQLVDDARVVHDVGSVVDDADGLQLEAKTTGEATRVCSMAMAGGAGWSLAGGRGSSGRGRTGPGWCGPNNPRSWCG